MGSRTGIPRTLRKARKQLKTWRAVSQELFDGKINGTILSRIANPKDDYWPVDKYILAILKPARVISPDTVCIRTLKIMSNEHQLHEIQDKHSTRKRTKVLLHSV